MATENKNGKYTDPKLREKIKDQLMQSDKGGKPGEWSARKSQLLVQQYEKQGGSYTGKKDEAAKSLEKWTEQDWQTQEGDERARNGKSVKRYLPKEVWEQLSPEEKKEAEQDKAKVAKKGKQHAAYTPAIKRAMRKANNSDRQPTKEELLNQAKKLNIKGRSRMKKEELQRAVEKAGE